MLIDRIATSFGENMNRLVDDNSSNVDALNGIIEFSERYFSIDINYLYTNNELFRNGYDKYQVDNPFLKVALEIFDAEDPFDVANIEIPQHPYSKDLHAIRSYRIALSIIDNYMEGGRFLTTTFKSIIQRVKLYLTEISGTCLQRITYLELIEYCVGQLRGYGVASHGYKFLASEWKENATRLYPESDIEEEYLYDNEYLRDPKYIKRML